MQKFVLNWGWSLQWVQPCQSLVPGEPASTSDRSTVGQESYLRRDRDQVAFQVTVPGNLRILWEDKGWLYKWQARNGICICSGWGWWHSFLTLFFCSSAEFSFCCGCLFLVLFLFLLHLQHMEVPGLGIKSKLQLRPTPQPQQHWIRAVSANYAAGCGNTRSLTHWVRPGIKHESLQCQVLNPLSHSGNSRV